MDSPPPTANRWARFVRIARAAPPTFGAIAAVVVAVWTFIAFTMQFPGAGSWQRIFSTLITFADGYTAPAEPRALQPTSGPQSKTAPEVRQSDAEIPQPTDPIVTHAVTRIIRSFEQLWSPGRPVRISAQGFQRERRPE